jgi:hypothetical protein
MHNCDRGGQVREFGSCSFFWNVGMLAAAVAKGSNSLWVVAFYNICFSEKQWIG